MTGEEEKERKIPLTPAKESGSLGRMKKAGKAISWTIRIAIILAIAYFLRPLYAPPKPTMPASRGGSDSISWIFHSDTNAAVVQTLTVFGDGRHAIIMTRAIGDPDLPELNASWKITRDKATGLSKFRNESLLATDKAKALFEAALQAGVLDLQPEPAETGKTLEMQTSFGGQQRSTMGPEFLGSAFDINQGKWLNRTRWQKLGNLIDRDETLRNLLAKKQVTLVDDDGKEVK
jgi:hypothetical protein